uniref:Secreted protein n=1 Tax=Anopheles darlingi TaxID=43151 RepID=A0A2M4DET1_ANODA
MCSCISSILIPFLALSAVSASSLQYLSDFFCISASLSRISFSHLFLCILLLLLHYTYDTILPLALPYL